MKRLKSILIIVVVVALFVIGAYLADASTPTGATYDVFVRGMMAQECGSQCAAFEKAYVDQNYTINAWWQDPLRSNINSKFPKWAIPLSKDELTRYALARAWNIAVTAQKDCQFALIRDNFPRFPSSKQFESCDYPHSDQWWTVQYPWIVEQTRADFNVNPVFKQYDDRAWCERLEYRRAFGECGIVTGSGALSPLTK